MLANLLKLTFWLLDINPKIDDDAVELWLWGIDQNGCRVLVIDREVIGYFYAVVKEGFDPSKIATEIMNFKVSRIKIHFEIFSNFFSFSVK